MKFVQAKHFYSNGNDPKLIVIHDMEYPENNQGASWCADFFAGPNAPSASAHYAVSATEIVQMVKNTDGAWHTPGMLGGKEINRFSIGVEHAGYAKQTRDEWLDDYSMQELELSAGLVALLCHEHSIPPVKLSVDDLKAGNMHGICGHADCTKASGSGSHWDPGPNFPWDWYMGRVKAHYDLLNTAVPVTTTDDGLAAKTPDGWIGIMLDGIMWTVAPSYIWPIGIGQAETMATMLGCELPSPELVDAIWKAADLKVNAWDMTQKTNGTMAEMASLELFNRQAALLEQKTKSALVQMHADTWTLMAGNCKDVVKKDGAIGIYGWHDLGGRVIQPFYDKHALGWIDYSQGLRLCRRVP